MNHSILGAGARARQLGRLVVACALVAVSACDTSPDSSAAPATSPTIAPAVITAEKPASEKPTPAANAPASPAPADAVQPVAETKSAREPVAKPVATEIEWFKGTLDEALVKARKENKLVFVDFWTTWCGWCKKLDKDTYTDASVIAALNAHYVCMSLDAETKVGAPLARRYAVNGYPTLLMLTTDGLVRERINGYKPPEPFTRIVLDATKPR